MKLGATVVVVILCGTVLSPAGATRSLAEPRTRPAEAIGGFGELSWGDSVERAQAVHDDLYFARYVLEDSRKEPARVYLRKDETESVGGVVFDSIEYWFEGNRFHKVRAIMRSRIGPRSLITRCEESFTRLHQGLARKYGSPTKFDESYFADFVTVTRVAQWDREGGTAVLTYKGPEGTNEDRLEFELREGRRR